MTEDEMITAADVAKELGVHKATVFKVMRRLGINGTKQRDSSRGNQNTSYVTRSEYDRIGGELRSRNRNNCTVDDELQEDGFCSAELDVFYLIQLEPSHDPQRFKVGFAANMADRLRTLRCSAPFSAVLKTWPCRRLWEKTAIDCVSVDCEQVHTEVFRAVSIEHIMARCDQFFGMMPALNTREQGMIENITASNDLP